MTWAQVRSIFRELFRFEHSKKPKGDDVSTLLSKTNRLMYLDRPNFRPDEMV